MRSLDEQGFGCRAYAPDLSTMLSLVTMTYGRLCACDVMVAMCIIRTIRGT